MWLDSKFTKELPLMWKDWLGEKLRGKVARNFLWAVVWQFGGKLIQIIGVGYATRCLGVANVGLSGTVFVVAVLVQFILELGVDNVAIRFLVTKPDSLREVSSALFRLKLLLGLVASFAWILVVYLMPILPEHRPTWLCGAPFLLVVTLSYTWFFQATERMAQLSFFQAIISIGTSLSMLLFFRPGQTAGSDLFVTLILNVLVSIWVWWRIIPAMGEEFGLLGSKKWLKLAMNLVHEGRANWVFNLSYYGLTAMGQPLLFSFSTEEASGFFRSLIILVTALQLFLNYFSQSMAPTVILWRSLGTQQFAIKVRQLLIGVIMTGFICLAVLQFTHGPIYRMMYGLAFQEASGYLPILVFSKFIAMASGFLVWSLYSGHHDWTVARWTLWISLFELVLGISLGSRLNLSTAVWLNVGAEFLLFFGLATAFYRSIRNDSAP